MIDSVVKNLFVFGDLGPGLVQTEKFVRNGAKILSRRPVTITSGVVRLASGMVVAIEGGSAVSGDQLEISAPQAAWSIFEEWHGVSHLVPDQGLCRPIKKTAETDDGSSTEVIVYEFSLDRLPPSALHVVDGKWREVINQRPGLVQILTPRQKEYIRKLANCSGRDVVPIDLNLYREFLRLEVAVDKGRRLALTTLGQEVNRWLA